MMGKLFNITFQDLEFETRQNLISEVIVLELDKLKEEAEHNRKRYPKEFKDIPYQLILKKLYDFDSDSIKDLDVEIENFALELAERRCISNFSTVRVEI